MSADRSQAAGTIRRKLTAAARVTETPDQAEHWAAAQEQEVEVEAEAEAEAEAGMSPGTALVDCADADVPE